MSAAPNFGLGTRVLVELNHAVDVGSYARSAQSGAVPDQSPYGLDALVGCDVRFAQRSAERVIVTAAKGLRGMGGGFDWLNSGKHVPDTSYDVRLCWEERNGIPAAFRRRARDAAVVTGVIWMTDHDNQVPRHVRGMVGRAFDRCSAVFALSTAQLPVLRDDWSVSSDRLHHVTLGVDTEFWSAAHEVDRPSDGFVVLGVGNDRHRDHDLLAKSMTALARRRGDVNLRLATSLPVTVPRDTGVILPPRSHVELRAEYARADVVAVALTPNLHVSGMTAILEAQSMGRPVVVTDTAGMSDYLINGVTGVLVPPGDQDAMTNAIDALLSDPVRMKEMGAAARDFVSAHRRSADHLAQLAHIVDGI